MGWCSDQWKMLLFWSEEEEEDKEEAERKTFLAVWRLCGLVLLLCFIATLGCVVRHENTRR